MDCTTLGLGLGVESDTRVCRIFHGEIMSFLSQGGGHETFETEILRMRAALGPLASLDYLSIFQTNDSCICLLIHHLKLTRLSGWITSSAVPALFYHFSRTQWLWIVLSFSSWVFFTTYCTYFPLLSTGFAYYPYYKQQKKLSLILTRKTHCEFW